MLTIAADNFAALRIDNISLLEGAIDDLPLADDSVDAPSRTWCSTTPKSPSPSNSPARPC
jgi:hypothetical protein